MVRITLALVLAAPVAFPADPQEDDSRLEDGRTYVSRAHRLTFSVPSSEWGTLRIKGQKKWEGKGDLAEGVDKQGHIGLRLAAEPLGLGIEDYRKGIESAYRDQKGTKKFTLLSRKTIQDGRLRCDYDWEFKQWTFRFVAIYFVRGKIDYRFCVWAESRLWGQLGTVIEGILGSLQTLPEAPPVITVARHAWTGFKVGSTATFRSTSPKGPVTISVTLVATEEKGYSVRKVVRGSSAPVDVIQRYRVDPSTTEPKKEAEGEETLEVAGKKILCRWKEWKEGKTTTRVWTSEEVPGRTVKTVVRGPAGSTETVLIGFEKK